MNPGAKVAAIVLDTGRELAYRKTLLFYFGIVTLTHLFLLLALQTDVANGVITSIRLFGLEGSVHGFGGRAAEGMGLEANQLVRGIQIAVTWTLYPIGVMLAVFATASLVPHMLEKGTIDLLLSKPVSRPVLFVSRYLGALLVAGANLFYFVGGVGVILAIKTGVWNGGFFLSGLLMTVYFGALLAFLVLIGVLLRSTTIGIMSAAAVYFVSLIVAFPHANADWPALLTSKPARWGTQAVVEVLYHALPRTLELGNMVTALVMQRPVASWMPVAWTIVSGAGALLLAIAWFRRCDF
ncbi:MAG TPA: ABC transporter permease [Candidatus Polarisedimenticolia bacterium]|nr:ABC transporter permease [Candidatus Polarisedimenticolia bacterium]